MYQIYRNWTKEDHPQLPSKRKDLWKGERWLVKILCTAMATLMSSWRGCGVRVLFHKSGFSSFLKYTKLSAAQSNILAMLITSCSQIDHRHSGLHNKIIQMHSKSLHTNIIFSHHRAQVGTGEMLCCGYSDIFEIMTGKKRQNTSRTSANLKRHKISDYVL